MLCVSIVGLSFNYIPSTFFAFVVFDNCQMSRLEKNVGTWFLKRCIPRTKNGGFFYLLPKLVFSCNGPHMKS